MTSPQAVSYWLLPAPEAQAVLDQLSALASQALVACRLPPHITLYSEHLDGEHGVSQEQVIAQLQQLADCRQPVRLRPNAIEASLLFTQSLVLRFNAEAMTQLHPWFNQLRRRSAAELGYRLDPHLSLLYSQDPFDLRHELAQRLPLPSDPLLFGRVSAVTHPLTISSPADIAACTTLHACSLSCSC
jgi:hypothetical protein